MFIKKQERESRTELQAPHGRANSQMDDGVRTRGQDIKQHCHISVTHCHIRTRTSEDVTDVRLDLTVSD